MLDTTGVASTEASLSSVQAPLAADESSRSGSQPPPAKIQKRRGRPPLNRPSLAQDDASSVASSSTSPSKMPYTGKRRGRPPGSTNKTKGLQTPPAEASSTFTPNSGGMIISSLAYTPPDPSNHPLRKNGQIKAAPPLHFDYQSNAAPAGSPAPILTQATTSKKLPPRSGSRIFGLQDAPVFYPTMEEFADPTKYIAWLASPEGGNAKDFGIAKIVPPEGWTPDFVLDQEKFRFRTRVQRLNSLSAEARATLNYHEQLQKFHSQQGSKRVSIPIIDRKPTDLYSLRRVVDAFGGFDVVSKGRKWTEVTRKLGYPEKECSQLSAQVKAAYIKIIMPFEIFLAKAKEQERTVNFSVSPAPGGTSSMTMAGSAPLQSSAAAVNGAPRLQMTINDAAPDRLSSAEPSPAANGIAAEQQQGESQIHSAGAADSSSQRATSMDAQGAPDATAAGTPQTAIAQAGSSTSDSQPNSSHVTPSATRISLKIDPQTRPAAAAAAALAIASNTGTRGPDGKSWSEELLEAGLTPEEIAQIEAEAAGKRRSSRKRPETSWGPPPATPPASTRKRKAVDDGQAAVVELLTTQGAEEQMCEICLRGDNGTSMLLCDDCNRGYHMFCLDPPLTTIPKSQWFCPPCLVGTGNDFGFDDGETHSLHSFWQRAELFRNSWWSIKKRNEEDSKMRAAMFGAAVANKLPDLKMTEGETKNGSESGDAACASVPNTSADGDVLFTELKPGPSPQPNGSSGTDDLDAKSTSADDDTKSYRGVTRPIPGTKYTVTEDEIEREYWRLVHSPQEAVEVEYGADIHSTTHGSALPTLETHPENPYSKDAWNLNNLPITSGSLLRYIKSDISGMTVPWIYVGMMFSTFCWHNEDHFTYSVNYQHWGETKTWYGVPGADAQKFEEAMRKVAPDLFETSPDLLFQLVTMMSPERLQEAGVRVFAADQRPNEFMVTFPKAYHSGFNQGFNLNEAVNFALPDWIDTGLECVQRYQHFRKFPVFSHDELLCTILHHYLTVSSAVWLRNPVEDMVARELNERYRIRQGLPHLQERLEEYDRPESDYQCAHCNVFCYLSQIVSTKGAKIACLEHAPDVLGAEETSTWVLRKRFEDDFLASMRTKVADRANQPAHWKQKFKRLLIQTPRPNLKSLRTLLSDGERITGLPEVEQLRDFINTATDWVERASAVIARRPHRAVLEPAARRTRGPTVESDASVDGLKEPEKNPEQIRALIKEVEHLGFESPEVLSLYTINNNVNDFKHQVKNIFAAESAGAPFSLPECYKVQQLGERTNVEMEERKQLDDYLARRAWFRDADSATKMSISIDDACHLLTEAERLDLDFDEPLLADLRDRLDSGNQWVKRAQALVNLQAPEPRITLEELEELLSADLRVPVDEPLRLTLDALHKKFTEYSKTLKSIISTQEQNNVRYFNIKRADDPSSAISRAKMVLHSIDKMHLAVPNTELVRMHVLRNESWVKRFEDVVLDAFSPFSTPSRNRLESMMDALCSEIQHTADPWDHYPTFPPRRHCVCRTLYKPPDDHRDIKKCSSCSTTYHVPCLKIEAQWDPSTTPSQKLNWRCPVCEPGKLPSLLQHRQTLSLNSIMPLVTEEAWEVQNFLFIPLRWYSLRKALDRLERLSGAISEFLDKRPTPVVPDQAYMLWHSMRKVLACPVEIVLPDGVPVVDVICRILYRHAGLTDKGRKPKPGQKVASAYVSTHKSMVSSSQPPPGAVAGPSQQGQDSMASTLQPMPDLRHPHARHGPFDAQDLQTADGAVRPTQPAQTSHLAPDTLSRSEATATVNTVQVPGPSQHTPSAQKIPDIRKSYARPGTAEPQDRQIKEEYPLRDQPTAVTTEQVVQAAAGQPLRGPSEHLASTTAQVATQIEHSQLHYAAPPIPSAWPKTTPAIAASTLSTGPSPRISLPVQDRCERTVDTSNLSSSTPKVPPPLASPMLRHHERSDAWSPSLEPNASPVPQLPTPKSAEPTKVPMTQTQAEPISLSGSVPASPEHRKPPSERMLVPPSGSSGLKTPEMSRSSPAGPPGGLPSSVGRESASGGRSPSNRPPTITAEATDDDPLNLRADTQTRPPEAQSDAQENRRIYSLDLEASLNLSADASRATRDASFADGDDLLSDREGDFRNDYSEGGASPPTLQSLPKKRGKRAKLVFEEEIGSTIPVKGVLAPCLCRRHREVEMISCDRCSNWYHLDCVVVTPYQAKTDKRWCCPFCCLKTERKYQYAEVKVKDAHCAPGLYVDVRATLRSTDEVIRKPQHWMLSNHRRIVLHLHHFVPAISAAVPSWAKDSGDGGDGTASQEGSTRGSIMHDVEGSAPPASPHPLPERPKDAAEDAAQATPTDVDQNLLSAAKDTTDNAAQAPPADDAAAAAAHARPADNDQNRPFAAPSAESTSPIATRKPADSVRRSKEPGPPSGARAANARLAEERHRLGMQNLYSRGVTDAMIKRWYIGWDGQKLVYPLYMENGRLSELDLGPSITLAPDDPDGSKLINARIAQRKQDARARRDQSSQPPQSGLQPSFYDPDSESSKPSRGSASGPRRSRDRDRERDRDRAREPPTMPEQKRSGYSITEVEHRASDGRPRIVPSSSMQASAGPETSLGPYHPHHGAIAVSSGQHVPHPGALHPMYRGHYGEMPYGWDLMHAPHPYDPYREHPPPGFPPMHPGMRPYEYDPHREHPGYHAMGYSHPQPSYGWVPHPDPRAMQEPWPPYGGRPPSWAPPPQQAYPHREASPSMMLYPPHHSGEQGPSYPASGSRSSRGEHAPSGFDHPSGPSTPYGQPASILTPVPALTATPAVLPPAPEVPRLTGPSPSSSSQAGTLPRPSPLISHPSAAAAAAATATPTPTLTVAAGSSILDPGEREAERRRAKDSARKKLRPDMGEAELEESVHLLPS